MGIPSWVIEAGFVILVMWFVDRQIKELKKWVEGLVIKHGEANSSEEITGHCQVCGKLKSEDYAECPTCHRRFLRGWNLWRAVE